MASFAAGHLGHRDGIGLAQGYTGWGRAGHWSLSLRPEPVP